MIDQFVCSNNRV